MKPARRFHFLPLLLLASLASAQERISTEAQRDGLAGPVQSVATTSQRFGLPKSQPPGPLLVQPILWPDSAYDPDGYKIRSGTVIDGIFQGELSSLERDSGGQTMRRHVANATTGERFRDEELGPFGKTSETDYQNGQPFTHRTISYDENGHLSGVLSFDSAGELQSRYFQATSKDGVATEMSVWNKNDQLQSRQTYDPKTDEDRFTSYDETGEVKVSFFYSHGEIVSFWAQTEDVGQFGERFYEDQHDGTVLWYNCRKSRSCEQFAVRSEFQSPNKRNLRSMEWRAPDGQLLYGSYCEYELDSFQNWTHRRVFVVSPEQPERTLYEEDSRMIVYWQK